jgi:hypothetical protein
MPPRKGDKPKAEAPKESRPIGRPSKYEPRFCEMVMEDMAKGFSLTAFAGLIGVNRDTIHAWMKEHPDFSEAVTRAKAARLRNWEEVALKMRTTGGGPGGATITVFGLKNMGDDEWSDRHSLELSGKGGGPIETSDVTPRERIASRIASLSARGGPGGDTGGAE